MSIAVACMLFGLCLASQDTSFKREGQGDRRQKLDKLEGQPAPVWEVEKWVQGEVSATELKGKVVLLDFWGVW